LTSLQFLANEFAITIANGEVWLAIGLALLLGGLCWVLGTWVARTVGLLQPNAPAGEILGVGLGSGLMVLAAWWAAIWSGGKSSFTPMAVGFVIAIALGLVRSVRGSPSAQMVVVSDVSQAARRDVTARHLLPRRSVRLTAVAGGMFVIAVALLYGSTLAPSPRDGVQPVEFTDEAFYSILGRDLSTSGTETNLSPSGFSDLPDYPSQTWYHWGELWLGSAVISLLGVAPVAARHFVVLPLVLLAAAALTGTLVRRVTVTTSRVAYLFGFIACLFLAPVPFLPIPYFSGSNVGLIFGITTYGLGAVAVLLGLYSLVVISTRKPTWELAAFVGSAVAFILPAHIAFALLAVAGVGTVLARRVLQTAIATRRLPVVPLSWRHAFIAIGVSVVAAVAWGLLTGHSQGGGSGSMPVVSPFNQSWRDYVAITVLGGGVFFSIVVGWFIARTKAGVQADLYLGTIALLVAGAVLWGARLGEFTMFHAFFGGIAVFATPATAIGVRAVWERLRTSNHRLLAASLIVLCALQLDLGLVNSVFRLQSFGPHDHAPTPVDILAAIKDLPTNTKLAYACSQSEEIGFATPGLLSIDAHTGRRVVPMCFATELLTSLVGAAPSAQAPSLFFQGAPQLRLYPTAEAKPSSGDVIEFLKGHGINYIYADASHPNTLVNDAVLIASSGGAEILRIP
jgi:hypothetical protein